MTAPLVQRDERTVMVENASYRWAYFLLSYGLLVIVAYRSLIWRQSSWDLLGLVILAGAVPLVQQARQHVLSERWARLSIIGIVLSGLLAALLVWLKLQLA
jgi:hypothetical protein